MRIFKTERTEHDDVAETRPPCVVQQPVHATAVVMRHNRHVVADHDLRRFVFQIIHFRNDALRGIRRNNNVASGLGNGKRKFIPAGLQIQLKALVFPTNRRFVRFRRKNPSDERLADQRPRRKRQLQMNMFRLLQHNPRDQQVKLSIAVFQREMMLA